jgi:hypothetical protein
MPKGSDRAVDALLNKQRRCVALRRDGDEFVVVFYLRTSSPFRNFDANALRKVCTFLHWKIVSDTSLTLDDL